MKMTTLALLLAVIIPGAVQTRGRSCPSIAHNERMEATDVRCVNADVYVIGGREQLSRKNWNGREFQLYRMMCVVRREDQNHISTYRFHCEGDSRYVRFLWRFSP
jgi:hypothetical protein